MNMTVRFATRADARKILETQHSAIHEIAAKDYPQEVVNEWARPITPEAVEKYSRALSTQSTVVAEIDGDVVGFGEIVESMNELRAVYVAAKYARRGVGRAILEKLE